jgi:mRNA-degrading endonuclease RelE of RelBE toxin-antitoxin system
MDYRLLYSQTSRQQIKALHPQSRSVVKAQIDNLRDNPGLGKALERELSGNYSLKTRRLRIIYQIDHDAHIVQIHYVGHRRDVYALFKDLLTKQRETLLQNQE